MVTVTFLPQNKKIEILEGQTVLDAALENGVTIMHECGGFCSCCTCQIDVVSSMDALSSPTEEETERLADEGIIQKTRRLACQSHVQADVTVRIVNEPI